MKPFFAGLKFLTLLPVPEKWVGSEHELSKSVLYFPLVGLVLGGLTGLLWMVCDSRVHPAALSVMIIAFTTLLSGGLHADGLADTADAFFSSKPRDRMLEIMKDPHLGTMGVLALIFTMLLKVTLMYALLTKDESVFLSLVLLMMLSRSTLVWGMFMSPYVRTSGLGLSFWDEGREVFFKVLLLTSLLTMVVYGFKGLGLVAVILLISFIFSRLCHAKLSGATGDTLGAQLELSECVILFVLAWL